MVAEDRRAARVVARRPARPRHARWRARAGDLREVCPATVEPERVVLRIETVGRPVQSQCARSRGGRHARHGNAPLVWRRGREHACHAVHRGLHGPARLRGQERGGSVARASGVAWRGAVGSALQRCVLGAAVFGARRCDNRTRRGRVARSLATEVARLAVLPLLALGACRDAAPPTEPSGVRSVSIALEAQQIIIGAATRAVATLRDAQGRTITDVTPTWSSLTPAILAVSSDGEVRGLQAGTGQIRAASGSVFSDVIVIVRNPLAGNIRLARDTATIFVPSGSVQAIAAVTDEQGAPIVNPAVAWTSSAAQVATVNGTGLVTAVASGTAVITGTIDNLSATLTVRVRPAANALAPSITLVEPATLRPGAVFTISGQRFGATPGGNLVHVDGVLASVQSASPTQLTIALPPTGFACEPSRNAFLQIAANGAIGGGLVPLQIGARRALAVGQSLTVSAADEIRCNELVPATGRWVVSIYNAGRTPPGAAGVGSVPFAIRGLAPGASTASTATAQLSADAEPPLAALLRQG
ncbi:MAG: hypothetical protein FJ202_11965, partial [Gemmatimonadetes bacterium]|nr:hypothetical protein [Gemmatimonadota bacterium]